jgi:hypothetical protein
MITDREQLSIIRRDAGAALEALAQTVNAARNGEQGVAMEVAHLMTAVSALRAIVGIEADLVTKRGTSLENQQRLAEFRRLVRFIAAQSGVGIAMVSTCRADDGNPEIAVDVEGLEQFQAAQLFGIGLGSTTPSFLASMTVGAMDAKFIRDPHVSLVSQPPLNVTCSICEQPIESRGYIRNIEGQCAHVDCPTKPAGAGDA